MNEAEKERKKYKVARVCFIIVAVIGILALIAGIVGLMLGQKVPPNIFLLGACGLVLGGCGFFSLKGKV